MAEKILVTVVVSTEPKGSRPPGSRYPWFVTKKLLLPCIQPTEMDLPGCREPAEVLKTRMDVEGKVTMELVYKDSEEVLRLHFEHGWTLHNEDTVHRDPAAAPVWQRLQKGVIA